jgi:hypothetical protein
MKKNYHRKNKYIYYITKNKKELNFVGILRLLLIVIINIILISILLFFIFDKKKIYENKDYDIISHN